MPPIIAGVQVSGPVVIPNRYGLLTVVDPITPENGHWEDGVFWDDDLCSDIHSLVENCPIPVTGSTPMIADRDFQSCEASPFRIYASYDCPPVGNTAEEAFSIVKNRLSIREGRGVERVFWRGLTENGTSINPSLAFGNICSGPPVDLTPIAGTLGIVGGMSLLESALGECSPGAGVIHANYGLAGFLAEKRLIYPNGDAWFTVTGQRLAIGAGYPGSGPNNIAAIPGTTWLFATGPIGIYRSEVFLTPERFKEAVGRSLNSVQIYAERIYAVGYSCCSFAVRVALC